MKKVTLIVLLVLSFLFTNSAFGHTPEVTNGLNFLSTVQGPDGSWGDLATNTGITPSTAAVLQTLAVLNESTGPEYSAGTACSNGVQNLASKSSVYPL
jgi:hypothetical protein